MSNVTVYSRGGVEALHTVTLKHAIGMLIRGVARELEWIDGQYVGRYRRVTAVELIHDMVMAMHYRRTGKVMLSKTNILRRDHYRCAYCGQTGRTIDHIVPRAQGGKTSWMNCVAACQRCNGVKADRTPEQANMRLDITPYVPTMEDLGLRKVTRQHIICDQQNNFALAV